MLVEFANGQLPWRKIKDKEQVGLMKEKDIDYLSQEGNNWVKTKLQDYPDESLSLRRLIFIFICGENRF